MEYMNTNDTCMVKACDLYKILAMEGLIDGPKYVKQIKRKYHIVLK